MNLLKKRIVASMLAITMIVSSLHFSTYEVYAEEVSNETTDVMVDTGEGGEASSLQSGDDESGSEIIENDEDESNPEITEGADYESEPENVEDGDNGGSSENVSDVDDSSTSESEQIPTEEAEYADSQEQTDEENSENEESAFPIEAKASSGYIAKGKSGNITWSIDNNGKLLVEGTGDFEEEDYDEDDFYNEFARAPWYGYCTRIKFAEVNVTGMTDASWMFYNLESLTRIDLSGFDTSKITDMSHMFDECTGLTSIDVSGFDTSNVINMEGMFSACSSLNHLDLSNFNTEKVTNMSYMFGCYILRRLDISSFDTKNVTNMSNMFSCARLTDLDVSKFNTANVTDMSYMFSGCGSLSSIDVSGFNTANVTDMSYMFSNCENLTNIDLRGFNTEKVTKVDRIIDGCASLKSVDMSNFNIGNATDLHDLFGSCDSLESIKTPCGVTQYIYLPVQSGEAWITPDEERITYLPMNLEESVVITKIKLDVEDGGNVEERNGSYENITWTIDKYGKLTVEGTGNFAPILTKDEDGYYEYAYDRAPWYNYGYYIKSAEIKVKGMTDASYMFYECRNLTSIDLSDFDTSQVTNMIGMFSGCAKLTSLDLSGFNTAKVTAMGEMFCYCKSLTDLNVSFFNTAKVTDMHMMFDGCASLTSLDLSNFNTANVTDMSYMIGDCFSLTDVNLSSFNTAKVQDIYGMFSGTYSLESLDLSNFNLSKATTQYSVAGMFAGCGSLSKILAPINLKGNVTLPVLVGDKWYQSDRKEVISLPLNLKKSIVLTKNRIPDAAENPSGSINQSNIKVELVSEKPCIYTGYAITPKIVASYNGIELNEGSDYTVKYSNNIKAGSGKITVTGKGNLSGSKTVLFTIEQKRLDNEDYDPDDETAFKVEGDVVTVVEGSKISPVLVYGGVKLTTKDFKVPDEYKNYSWKLSDNTANNNSYKTITVTADSTGNFKGSRELIVKVIPKSEQKNYKLAVSVAKTAKNFDYTGQPRKLKVGEELTVSTRNMPTGLIEGEDYIISYPNDVTSAGTKKFTVTGISDRCMGAVTQSYTIKPKKIEFSVAYDEDKSGYTFVSTGTKVDDLVVKDGGTTLVEGKDYKVSYSGNKKVGTNAKLTVTGLGSYKGSKYKGSFTINPAVLNNNPNSTVGMTDNLKIAAADKVFKKAGIYKSAPYVSINGVLLKASDYTVTYYLDDPAANSNARVMGKDNKVTNENGDTTIWVKIVGKGNYKPADEIANNTCYAIASYKVRSLASSDSYDLSKAKVTFRDKTGNTVKKASYTGTPITGENIGVVVTYKIGKETVTLTEGEHYTVEFINNVNKGKATVVITGKDDQTKYVGSKSASFSIAVGK
ncbi:MAG: BspA family leucine-rich repeat surface protein [Lachnospiraceae bacterium]|nr:BspA family leucine-rich repeat surface protein [Lachnospiraceae bacterium]